MDRQEAIDLILDHYEHPRHRGRLTDPTFSGEGVNPGCGDVIRLDVRLDDQNRIAEIAFDGQGCTISQAAASLLTEMAEGQPLVSVMGMDSSSLTDALGEQIVNSRVACATLALDVFKQAAQRSGR